MKSFKNVFCTFLFLLAINNLNAQQNIVKGRITDSLSQPISRVSIIASYDKEETNIIAYTNSDNDGNYTLNFEKDNEHKDLWLSFRHISHSIQKIKFQNKSQTIDIILNEQSNILDEIILNAKKIVEVKGDTITYNVQGIKKEKDYSIEEVIARIPGVKIAENGQISYNNKIISHLYVNGVDLLEGRYNIATRGIPADAVEEIDILKKHNHALIDNERTDSDEVAFNLKIRKDHSLIFGSGKANAGFPLLTAKVEVTPIYINEGFQDIASSKVNNIGESLESNGSNLTRQNRDFDELGLSVPNVLSAPNTNGTSISNRFWLDNNSISLTNDALVKSGKGLILKAGINYNSNEIKLQSITNQVFFFDQDSTLVNQNTRNELKKTEYYIGLVQEVNKDRLYLKNKISINRKLSRGFSNIVQNENPLDYLYNAENTAIKNTTSFKTTIKDKIVDNGLLVEYLTNKENNEVTPVVFTNEVLIGANDTQTKQIINTNQFSIGAYSSYDFRLGKYKSQIKQRINWKSESLTGNLNQIGNDTENQSQFPFASDFRLNTFESLTTLKSVISIKSLTITLNPEIRYINLNQKESFSTNLNKKNNYVFLQPSTSIKYEIDHQWNTSLTGNYIASVSRFPQLFNSVILRNYNSLYRNPNDINVTRTVFGTFYFGYSNILKGVLFSNSTRLSSSKSDFTLSSSIDEDGLIQIDAVNEPNKRNNFTNTTNLAKSFFRILKTDFSYTFSKIKANQIFNSIEQETNSINHAVNIAINIDNNTWYGFKYEGTASFGRTTSNGFENSNTFIKHNLELDFYTSSKTRINFGTESVFTSFSSSSVNNRNTLFNAKLNYKPTKKLILHASFNNILNEEFFTTVQSNSNFISQSQFSLRPRQFTIGLNFSF